jgi:MtrB/PioB family decaheme-associated outer membrane protein
MKINYQLVNVLCTGLLVLPVSLAAQDEIAGSDANFSGEFDIGAYVLSDDAMRFGKFTGLTDDGFEPLVNFKLRSTTPWDSDEAKSWYLQGWRLGLDSMRLEFEYEKHGSYEFNASYREIPNYRFNDGMTPFNGVGTGNLSLPSDWVGPANSTTGDFTALASSLSPFSVGSKRERFDVAYDYTVSRSFSFNVDWRHETKDGLRTFGGVIGNSGGNPRAVILPSPVDWQTEIMEATFNYANKRFQLGFSVYASWFDNDQTSVTWDNPYGQRSGWAPGVGYPSGQGLYSLEPNNEAISYRLFGGLNLGATSRLSADVSFGTMEQDDLLFDYSVNPALDVNVPLPRSFVPAEIETTHANLRYSVRPLKKLSLVASYTLDDRDNRTPRDEWIYIGGDSQHQKNPADARINLPYSYEKKKLSVNATLRAAHGMRFTGGFDSTDYTRSYSEVLASDETRYFAGVKLGRFETVSFSFDYANSDRDVDEYRGNRTLIYSHLPGAIDDDEFENHPALRKFNQTDREREEYRFRADFFPGPKFNFAVSGSWFEDDYNPGTTGLFGLQASDVSAISIDAGLYPREGVSLTAYYTIESYDSLQTGRQFTPFGGVDNAGNNWSAESADEVDTWNIALAFKDLNRTGEGRGNLEVGTDYTHSNVESDITVLGAANINATPLPTLVSRMQSWTIYGSYGISDRSSVRLSFEMQKLDTRDFALDNVPVDGPSNALLLGQSAANYDLSLLMLSWAYRY